MRIQGGVLGFSRVVSGNHMVGIIISAVDIDVAEIKSCVEIWNFDIRENSLACLRGWRRFT
jgi:hypothetical protein